MENAVRAHVIISGRVQGVCFRMETQHAAETLGVSGWVRNRNDGTVEALFEGDKASVEQMIQWCEKGPPLSDVKRVGVRWEKYIGEVKGFEITY